MSPGDGGFHEEKEVTDCSTGEEDGYGIENSRGPDCHGKTQENGRGVCYPEDPRDRLRGQERLQG